jgi:hypothetical protein
MMKLTGSRNQCGACHQYFNSNSAFSQHRIGKHGEDRRCLTPEEILAKGWTKNSAGFWIMEARPDGIVNTDEEEDEPTT